ncbi:MAG: phosphotransferase [Alphaproteobacteria bacterium]|nr:phosphotransferase [Alphaproteobacteria bacterium]
MNRETAITDFLARTRFSAAHRAPLAQDASFRRYWRLSGGLHRAVLMDAPPPEDVRPFLTVRAHLATLGLSVPDILAADPEAGFVLLEDLGDNLFAAVTDDGPEPFEAAVDALLVMQQFPPPPDLPAWDPQTMAATALGTLLDWWWPAVFGSTAPEAARQSFSAALGEMLAPLAAEPPVFVHRDYCTANLVWLPARGGVRRVGLLDFQSAARGHPAYDLASLIEDARRDIPPESAERSLTRYLVRRPDLDAHRFRTALAICAAQRHLRVACQWVRLALRDRRPHYLAFGPRTWQRLDTALQHPAAAPLADAFARWIPPGLRNNPPGLAA